MSEFLEPSHIDPRNSVNNSSIIPADQNLAFHHVILNQRANTKLPSVELHNAYKHYGPYNKWKYVLNGCNLKANNGELYSILSPQETGKSTILNVLIGHSQLSKGEVQLFGFKPNNRLCGIPGIRLGYMPQKDGLHEFLSIDEACMYNANILQLDRGYLNQRIAFIYELLSLPKDSKLIAMYDVNINRRIAFGLAILHEPQLLILDEPTNKCNPDIRLSIWKHLIHLSNVENKTVIVATTSTEDAELTNRVGILYQGKIVIEGSPNFITQRNNDTSLLGVYRQVFNPYQSEITELIEQIRKESNVGLSENFRQSSSTGFKISLPLQNEKYAATSLKKQHRKWVQIELPRPRVALCIMLKNYRFILRHAGIVFHWIFIPTMLFLIVLISSGTRSANGIQVGILNKERPSYEKDCPLELASCDFIRYIRYSTPLTFIEFLEESDIERQSQEGDLGAFLTIPKAFTNDLLDLVLMQVNKTRVLPLESIRIDVFTINRLDEMDILEYLGKAVRTYYHKIRHKEWRLKVGYPFEFKLNDNQNYHNNFRTPNAYFVGPGALVCWTIYLSTTISALFYHFMRHKNLFQVYHALGIRKLDIIAGYFGTFGVLVILHTVVSLFALVVGGGMPVRGPWSMIVIAITLIMIEASCIGAIMGQVCRSWVLVAPIIFYWEMFITLTIGALWTIDPFPDWAKRMIVLLPHIHSLQIIRTVSNFRWRIPFWLWLSEPGVYMPLIYISILVTFMIILEKFLPN